MTIRGLPERHYVADARYESREAYARPVPIGSSGASIDITLAKDGPVVRGIAEVKPGVPAPGARVVLVSMNLSNPMRPDQMRSVAAGADGSFSITNVPPGDYRIDAYQDMIWYEAEDPTRLPSTTPKTKKITLAAKQDLQVTLEVSGLSR